MSYLALPCAARTSLTAKTNWMAQTRRQQMSRERERAPSGMKTRQKDAAAKKDSDRILIPTKTGKEPPKKLYPKESPPLYGGRFLPVGVGSLATMGSLAPQPHSLPIYPIQLAGAVPWGQHRSATHHKY